MAKKHTMQAVLELAGKFIVKQDGDWDHDSWEGFVGDVAELGVTVDDDLRRNLGNVLEAGKCLYAAGDSSKKAKPPKKEKAAKGEGKVKNKTKVATNPET
ncbi:MAG: hypothetical protein HYV26_22400 [Candidatus Hydrogenedentes bacterium]|nr:hypothetical protein [Candidatus Hydrogenedentota bacterium]